VYCHHPFCNVSIHILVSSWKARLAHASPMCFQIKEAVDDEEPRAPSRTRAREREREIPRLRLFVAVCPSIGTRRSSRILTRALRFLRVETRRSSANIKIANRVTANPRATHMKDRVARYYATAYAWYAYDATLSCRRSVNRKIYFTFTDISLKQCAAADSAPAFCKRDGIPHENCIESQSRWNTNHSS